MFSHCVGVNPSNGDKSRDKIRGGSSQLVRTSVSKMQTRMFAELSILNNLKLPLSQIPTSHLQITTFVLTTSPSLPLTLSLAIRHATAKALNALSAL